MHQKEFYLEVIFPAKLWQTFTYKPLDYQREKYFSGQRVLVPLRRQKVIGFVHRIHSNKPTYKVLRISEIIDLQPVFPKELYHFLEKLSEYYLAPFGQVLDSALPAEIKMQKFRTFYPNSEKNYTGELSTLYDTIEANPGIKYTTLKARIDKNLLKTGMNYLKTEGFIVEKPDFSAVDMKKKIKKTVTLTDDHDLSEIRANAKRQLEIIDHLKKNGSIEHEEISIFNSAALKTLLKKNIIDIKEEDVTIDKIIDEFHIKSKTISLNDQQQRAYEIMAKTLEAQQYKGYLLHGVTGSGKTEVYIKLIEKVLDKGQSAIVLVPEIALTTHLASRFYGAFHKNIAIWHSNLSSVERSNIWHKLSTGEINVVIGARSALFMPMQNLNLIIVDEEHEQSYKQQNPAPRYHARDAALLRGSLSQSVVVLGSATPSLESHYNALRLKLEKIEITQRYANATLNKIHLVDIKKEFFRSTSTLIPFSHLLIAKIEEKLNRNQQVILFHNRRGYSNFMLCANCGWTPKCKNCDIALTYHKNIKRVVCHYCDYSTKIPVVCPQCGHKKFLYPGFGTQKVETILTQRFPKAHIQRLDMDTTARRGHMQKVLKEFEMGSIQILVGTQMIAKGLDFPNVSLVGVLNADVGLFLPDFRAREKVFQLLYQVAGRTGRGKIPGEVVIQTYNPNDFTVNCAIQSNIRKFINNEYSERNMAHYPPFSRIATVNFSGKTETKVREKSQQVAAFLHQHNQTKIDILGPVSNPIGKIKNQFRYFLLLKSRKESDPSGSNLRNLLKQLTFSENLKSSAVNVSIDIDPSGMI